jgi:ornithine cyclodeaminase
LKNHLIDTECWNTDQIELESSADRAVARADIVVCATTSQTPTFSGPCLQAGTFVVAVGANIAEAREVDSETITRMAKIVIDSREDSLKNAGDLLVPISEKKIKPSAVMELSELVKGKVPGRENREQLTYYKSIGLPIQDLAMAQAIELKATAADIGVVIEIGGD